MTKATDNRRMKRLLVEFLGMTIGAIVAAFSLEEFLVPNTILDGGLIGIGIIINTLSGVSLSLLTLVLNIPVLLICARKLGKMFIVKSAYSMVVFSIFLEIFKPLQRVTEDVLLAVCFGGLILGIGVGLVIRCGGCLDGTEAVAVVLNRKFKFPVGRTVLLMNVVVYSIASILFGLDRGMYSLLTYFIASKVLDIVENGFEQEKAAMIITNDSMHIAEAIYKELGRTVTIMEGEGLVSGKKTVLYVVVSQFELRDLKNIINNADESAFVTVTDVSEIIGKHVKSTDQNILERKAKEKEQEEADKAAEE